MGKRDDMRRRRVLGWFWALVALPFAAVAAMILLTAAGCFGRLPSFEELENPKSNLATELYSADGKLLGSFYVQNRSYVDYDELSPALVAALVSTEDSRFYSHSGIDFVSLARVAVKTVAMGLREQGGGSTITQQLAKNLFPRDTTRYRSAVSRGARLVVTKFKEWITAVKLEYNYTKEEILAMYFNTVFYGSNAYGIKAAARTFFDKEPHELDIPEAAMLVGVVNAPTRYSPVRNPEQALGRRNTVINRMERFGYIDRAQRDSLSAVPIELRYTPISHDEGIGTYFREMIRGVMNAERPSRRQFANDWDYRQELERWENNPIYGWCRKNSKADGTPYNIYRDGLKIYTTLDSRLQTYAEEAVRRQMRDKVQPALDAQVRRTGVLFQNTSPEEREKILWRAMRYSDRYRAAAERGASDEEIRAEFRTPVRTRIFTYRGEVDTLISPRDSVLHHKRIMRASFVAMDPASGYVRAYVGGPDFRYFKYDMARQGKRQVGSTIKPFIYTFAIDHMGFTPCTLVPNLPVTIETYTGQPWTPKEAGSSTVYDGMLHPLRWGMAHSRNNYSAWIMKQAKQAQAVADFIHIMGIRSYIDPVDALCLGTPDVTLMEMTAAYCTFVNRGVYTDPIFVTRIEDRQGNVIATFVPTSSDAVGEQTAYTMTGMLQNVVSGGTAGRLRWMYGFTGEMGGKTGTTQDSRDTWFMGVVPKLVAGTWIGGEDQSVHLNSQAEGSVLSLPVFAEFMKMVYADPSLGITEADTFYRPPGAVDYRCENEYYPGAANEEPDDEFFE